MAASGGWSQWLRNGRLATIALAIVFITWLNFQLFAEVKPPILDQILLYSVGVWFGNLAIQQGRRDDAAAATVREVAEKVEKLEARDE